MNGSIILQRKRSVVIALLFLLSVVHLTSAQNVIGVVDYIKADDPDAYLEIEKQWQKIHQERLKQGMIIGWAVYKVMFKTTDDSYNYVSISWYDAFSKLDKIIPDEIYEAAYPGKSKEEWETFHQLTNKFRKRISSGVFHQRLSCANGLDTAGRFYVISEISVQPGKSSRELLSIYEDIYKPLYEEDIVNKNRTAWSLWEKWPGNMKDFQYGMADGYPSLDKIDHSHFMEYFKKIHPDKNSDEISDRIEELRTLVNSEVWKMEYRLLR